jgi:hypothetical protein
MQRPRLTALPTQSMRGSWELGSDTMGWLYSLMASRNSAGEMACRFVDAHLAIVAAVAVDLELERERLMA